MSNTPRIAMTPEQLPRQRIHEVVALPSEPAGFDPVVHYGSDALGNFPKRRPNRIHYLGSTEWAWGPMNCRIRPTISTVTETTGCSSQGQRLSLSNPAQVKG
jgi:hypothetical protein